VPTVVLVVLSGEDDDEGAGCCAVCAVCVGFVTGAEGGRDVVVLENVGELLCDGRREARVSRCGATRDGAGVETIGGF
jgi:hypothetical protein